MGIHPFPQRHEALKIEQLKILQYHEQQRLAAWANNLQDACRVPDADYKRIQSAFDDCASIVNKISDIGAELARLEQANPPPRPSLLSLAKSICAPAEFPDLDFKSVTDGLDRAIEEAKS
jgi:hypothetical protein